ncbi:hypothetical protein JQC67_17305 [Aurantibacter crassamenti]|uniref:hypothetical protein n=1 Tax=Aurantibacter crassamenti TaxID=1837375 RepID=UPI001939A9E3|nr:hypothetical protein [Aurantibacter crassamenti]MBM1107916.1 hypothetical protein [Aurantibacter crassamenti]
MKTKLVKFTLIFTVAVLLSSCVKKALDPFNSVKCLESYASLANEDSDDECAIQIENIDAILSNCSAYLSDSDKDDLRELRATCQGN